MHAWSDCARLASLVLALIACHPAPRTNPTTLDGTPAGREASKAPPLEDGDRDASTAPRVTEDAPDDEVYIEDEILEEGEGVTSDGVDKATDESTSTFGVARPLPADGSDPRHRIELGEIELELELGEARVTISGLGDPELSFVWTPALEFDATRVEYWFVGDDSRCSSVLALRVVGFSGEDVRRVRYGFALLAIIDNGLQLLWSDRGSGKISPNCASFDDFDAEFDETGLVIRTWDIAEIYVPNDSGYDCEDAVSHRLKRGTRRLAITARDCAGAS